MNHKRAMVIIISLLLLILFTVPGLSLAEPPALNDRINMLRELVDAIGSAGDAITKITDGFKHLVKTGVEGYDAASARSTYSRLVELSKASTNLAVSQNRMVVESLEEYIANPYPAAWTNVINRLDVILSKVNSLLLKVNQEKSDFVLRPAYEKLNAALQARVSLIERVKALPAPTTKEELKVLREASSKYKILIQQLRESRDEINKYLEQHKIAQHL